MKIEVGKEYDVLQHGRYCFRVCVDEVDSTGIVATITRGEAIKPFGPVQGPGQGVYFKHDDPAVRLRPVEQGGE